MNQKHFMALGSALFMTLSGAAIAASSHGHEAQHSTSAVSPPVNAGKKLATDVPLRQAMANIRQAMAGSLHDIHANKLSQKAYAALAQKVEDEVAYMVANCQLDKEADEQLHFIIADLLDGAGRMAGKVKSAKRQDGAVRVIGALDKYAALFDDSRF